MLQIRCNDNIHYPQKAYMQALEGMMFIRHICGLVVEIMVGYCPAFLAEAGYRYDAIHTRGHLGIMLDILEKSKADIGGMLLGNSSVEKGVCLCS